MKVFYKYLIFFILGIILSLITFKKDLIEGSNNVSIKNLLRFRFRPTPDAWTKDDITLEDDMYLRLVGVTCPANSTNLWNAPVVGGLGQCKSRCRGADCTDFNYNWQVYPGAPHNTTCLVTTGTVQPNTECYQDQPLARWDNNARDSYYYFIKYSQDNIPQYNKLKQLLDLQRDEVLCPEDTWLTSSCPNGFYEECNRGGGGRQVNGGFRPNDDRTGCVCADGRYESTVPRDVPLHGGQKTCSECPDGTYSNADTNHVCTVTPRGTQSNDDKSWYTPCTGNTKKGEGDDRCVSCGTNAIANDDHTACIDCEEGQTVVDGSCVFCPVNTGTNGVSEPWNTVISNCKKCAIGQESRTGTCYNCPIGKYGNQNYNQVYRNAGSDERGTWSAHISGDLYQFQEQNFCTFCPPGTTTENSGATDSSRCIDCQPNQISVQVPEWEVHEGKTCLTTVTVGFNERPGSDRPHELSSENPGSITQRPTDKSIPRQRYSGELPSFTFQHDTSYDEALEECKRYSIQHPESNCFDLAFNPSYYSSQGVKIPTTCSLRLNCRIDDCIDAYPNVTTYINIPRIQHEQTCQDCPENYIPNPENRSECIMCPGETRPNTDEGGGYYVEDILPGSVCVCPTGQIKNDNNLCLEQGQITNCRSVESESDENLDCERSYCPSGTEPNEDLNACDNCEFNKVSNREQGQPNCLTCNIGFGPNEDNSSCIQCTGNTFSNETTDYVCQQCPPGQITNDDFSSCSVVNCSVAGQYVNEDGVCTPCPYGTYSTESGNIISCTPCSANSITSSTGSTSENDCIACNSEEHANQDKSQCVTCPVGQSGDNCDFCTNNTIPNINHTVCEPCPNGQISVRGNDPYHFEEYLSNPQLKSRCVENPNCLIKPEDRGKYLNNGDPIPENGILLDDFDNLTSNLTCNEGYSGIPRAEKCSDYGRYMDLSGCVSNSYIKVSESGNITCGNFSELNNIDMKRICENEGKNLIFDKVCNNVDDCLTTDFCCTKNVSDKAFNLMGNIFATFYVDEPLGRSIDSKINTLNDDFTNESINNVLTNTYLKSGVLKSFKTKFNTLENFKKNWVGTGSGQEEIVSDVWKRFINTINKYRINDGLEKLSLTNLDLNPENNSNITYPDLEKYVKLFVFLLDMPIKNDVKCSDPTFDNEQDCIDNLNTWEEYKYPICNDRTKTLENCTGNFTWNNELNNCSNRNRFIDTETECTSIPIEKTGLSPLDLFLYNDPSGINSSQLESLL